jgi:sugar phosphate isomerase/epimerase
MRFGLVTYLWGQDWDLPTLIHNCEAAGYAGVELRTEHAHRVEPGLSPAARAEVRRRFADSPVVFVGYGSNQEFHSPDAALRRNIEGTFELIKLCHDLGASGVKVKPNTLPEGVPAERTIDQIARSLNEIGRYAAGFGQVIRLEVHGRRTSELPVIKQIMDRVTEPAVGLCWNCNPEDLLPPGLEANFRLVRDRFGDTLHVRELDSTDYPYPELMKLLVQTRYGGWVLLEARTAPTDRVAAMKAQLELFRTLAGGV